MYVPMYANKYHIRQVFRGIKLLWLERKTVISRKTFAVADACILILPINTAIDSRENIDGRVNTVIIVNVSHSKHLPYMVLYS